MRTRTPRARLCLIAACALAGCRGGSPDPAPPPPEAAGSRALPVVRDAGQVNGIEVRSWTIDPLGAPLGRALAAYAVGLERVGEGEPLPPDAIRAWRDQGFRLVEIPTALVEELEATLPHVDAVRRVWIGQPTRWTDLATRALPSDGGALGGRPVPVRATLAVRSWIEPGVRRRPVRVELALTGVPLDGSDARAIVLRDLLVAHRLEPGSALVIVPASPDEIWITGQGAGVPGGSDAREPAGPAAPGETDAGDGLPIGVAPLAPPGAEPSSASGDGAGPIGPRPELPRSLGESMLMAPGAVRSAPPRASREALVIVPAAR